jgi:pyridoxine kinase
LKQKRILTIQDISCTGRCSLTVALPIISSAGIEAAVIPTAVLSTHTGGFSGYTFRDLTEDIVPIVNHWKTLGLGFDAVYTGYLGSFKQVGIVSDIFDDFKTENNFIIVDPAMADNGELYKGFSDDFPKEMAKLCRKADIILPNLTEAALMLGEPYVGEGYDKSYIAGLVKRLYALGANVVLTGVSLEPGKLGIAAYDGGEVYFYFTGRIDGYFHGTGDVYASSFLAAYLKKGDLNKAASVAADFTVSAIEKTLEGDAERRYGVNFEECLPLLAKWLA